VARRLRLKPASPELLALAGLWSVLADLLVASLLLGVAIARWAPPEDLPWTPLRLDQPVGLATGMKFALAAGDPQRCRAILEDGGVRFAVEPDRVAGSCATRDTVRLQGVTLAPAAPVMTCKEALAYAFWTRHAVQPAARAELGEPILRVEHYGTYACRNMYGRATGMRSQHAYANALDVAAFRTASGRRISVRTDFRDEGPRGRFLRRARDGACPWFRAVLSPDYNAAHADHLHLDMGRFRACR
jgi:hypothetical protein